MHSLITFITRTSAFISKELIEILRQTRLLLALVLGPFLILFIFGLGFRNEARPLRTLFVVPPGQAGVNEQVQQYGTTLGPQIDYRGIVEDRQAALTDLSMNRVDTVVVIPENIEETIRKNKQPVIELYHHEIDPSQASYVKYVGQIYVDELNRRVLQKTAAQGQEEASTVRDDLRMAKEAAQAMRLAYESGQVSEAESQRSKMTKSIDAVSLGVGASLSVLQGIQEAMGPNQNAGEDSYANQIRATLNSIGTNNKELENTPIDKNNYSEEAQRAAQIEQDITRLETQLADFQEVDPAVMVSPFQSRAVGLNNLFLDPADFFAPGVIVLLLQHLMITFAALSLVRERTSGAMELFRVAPVTPFETLLGKYLSYTVVTAVLAAVITALVIFVLGVPMLGRWQDYTLVLLAVMFASLGVGFVISLLSETTSQAVQFSMLTLLFSIFFSGFFLDLRLLWDQIRFLSFAVPATYGLQMLQEIMFRANPIPMALMAGLVGFGLVLFIISWILLARQMRLR